MGKVVVNLSMSLDGFIAGPNDGHELPLGEDGEQLFKWYTSGDTEVVVPSGEMVFKLSPASARLFTEAMNSVGALVTGRRTFDITDGWHGRHPMDVPVFVVTHTIPQEWVGRESPFTFVTEGVESAVKQAKAVAGDKNVAVGAASIAQQCLKAGLLDEIQIDVAPVLLGGGVRLFEHLGTQSIHLESLGVIEAPDVTHLSFRVIK